TGVRYADQPPLRGGRRRSRKKEEKWQSRKGRAFPHGGRRSRRKMSKVQCPQRGREAEPHQCRRSRQREEEWQSPERRSLSVRRAAEPLENVQSPDSRQSRGDPPLDSRQ